MNLSKQLTVTLKAVEMELSFADHYAFLPEIKEALERMIADQQEPKATRSRHASALGRLVLEDYTFSESTLGEQLLAVSDSYTQ